MNSSLLHGLMWAVFVFTYVGIALGEYPRLVLDRTGIALLGGVFMLMIGALDIHQAARSIDIPTILLLFGLMIFSAQLRTAGFYDAVGRRLVYLSARPKTLLACLILVAALLSALLANDIVCLAFTPLLCAALLRAKRNPIPYLLALATGSNIGSAATLIGNPQNMYIGSAGHLDFSHFLLIMLVPVGLGLVLCFVGVVWLFWHQLHSKAEQSDDPKEPAAEELDWYLVGKTLTLLAALIAYFLLARGPAAAEHRAIAALAGAGILMISRRSKAAKLYTHVDYNLILLFLGLFVVNGAMQDQHLSNQIFSFIQQIHVNLNHPATLAGVTTALSNVVSNVPAVLLLAPAIHSKSNWYLLALISTWAGNLTLVGSIANLIVAEGAKAYGVRVTLRTYCWLGIPLTVATVLMGTVWIAWMVPAH
ncbi:MAG TPA: SLC13 family permease [Tepidisphaeraceae bacterium]|nr:SLC13 family permease [Tepidisphaeraceae bacterium]